ncbi:MAG TPA: SpaA isopeptide-forming pilin-related protein [Jiangellaceae bacterium]|nr:SpaA isopeptide-forming pilin-related protein [Jiangellaceae bacterium]
MRRTKRLIFGLAAVALPAALVALPASADHVIPGSPSGDGVTPTGVHGNPSCSDVLNTGDFLFEFKLDPPQEGTFPLTFDGLSGTVTVDITDSTFDFTFTGDFVAAGVIVKGGPNANFYDYRPNGSADDTGLHAPVNPSNGQFFGISHISFCVAEARAELEITKTAVDDTITVGDKAAFDITVTNLGPATAQNVTIDDVLPNTDLDWEIVSQTTPGACMIGVDGNTLHCSVGDLAPGASFTVRVQTTAPIPLGSDFCGMPLNNTAFADADNADEVDDDATINVICGAIEVNKFAKVPGSTSTQPVAGAGFTLFDNGTAITPPGQVTTGPDGVACFDGLPVNTTFRLSETTTPFGYATAPDRSVTSSAGNANCDGTGMPTTVEVENLPLTDFDGTLTAQIPGATNSTIVCVDDEGHPIGTSGPFGDPATVDIDGLVPGTYTCTLVIDP